MSLPAHSTVTSLPEAAASDKGQPLSTPPQPAFMFLLRLFLSVGFQSFGGGSSTFFLIHDAVVTRYGWVSEEEFARFWALCTLAPGINLVALTILIGKRVAGASGVAACLIGLLVPSAALTALMTAVFTQVQQVPLIRAAMRGVGLGAAGLSLSVAVRLVQPPLKRARSEGRASLAISVAIIAGCAALLAVFRFAPLVALAAGSLAGAAFLGRNIAVVEKA